MLGPGSLRETHAADPAPASQKPWTLGGRDGRQCLKTPDGKTFMMLGTSHVDGALANVDNKAARKEEIEKQLCGWGFNTVPAENLWDRFPFPTPAAAYETYLRDSFAKPYVLGYFKCQYVDQVLPTGMMKEGLLESHQGPARKEFAEKLAAIHQRLKTQLESEKRIDP